MKFNITIKLLLLSIIVACTQAANAAGSIVYNGYRTTAATDSSFEYADSLFIGPDAVWDIEGVLVVYCTSIWIAPTAQITGGGTLVIADPSQNPFYTVPATPTVIDGNNGNYIELNIKHQNPANIELADVADPGYATANPTGPLAAALNIGKDFSFDIDNGDVLLNGNDFVFDDNATVSNFSASRMVVTNNSIDGHLVKQNTSSQTFTFPVGIDEDDYTPATITGSSVYHVSVQDYAAAASEEQAPQEGMDRVWHIYGGAATSITLQHDITTNGPNYDDANAFITRYQGGGVWSTGTPEQTGAGVHTDDASIASGIPASGTDDGAYLSKASDAITPLPVKLLSFEAYKKGDVAQLEWTTSMEQNNRGFDIEHSLDGSNWMKIGYVASKAKNGNSSTQIDYNFTDEAPANGNNYYRLKTINNDGNYDYSIVRNVWFNEENNISIYPNPATNQVNIEGLQGDENIYLYDVSGRLVKQIKAGNQIAVLPLSSLSSGAYQITIVKPNGSTSSYKVVKQ